MTLVAFPALANEEDFNVWLAQTATIDVGDKGVVWLEAQERFNDNASRFGQLLLRPAVGYKLNKTTTAFLGYVYVRTDPAKGATTDEHRIFQQLSFRLGGDGKGLTVSGRTRLEERWVEGKDGTGWRLRQQIRVTAPLNDKLTGVAWTEPFIGLNKTSFQRDGVTTWRNFVGVSVPVRKGVTLEPGYLNQLVVRNGENRMDHTASFTLNTRF